MGHGARVGRVESIAVAARGMGEGGKVEWDAGMLRGADGGGRMARLAGRQREADPQLSNSSGSDWSNTKSGIGSTSVGSKAGV